MIACHGLRISERDLCLLHRSYCYAGSGCRARIPGRYGTSQTVDGIVSQCEFLGGKLHLIRVRFTEPFDIRFVPGLEFGEWRSSSAGFVDPGSLSGSVLLVEDCPMFRSLVCVYMNETGCTVGFAENAEVALRVLGESSFDVCICDFDLPDENASFIYREMRSRNIPTPMLVVSVHTVNDIKNTFGSDVPAGFLRKPVEKMLLFNALGELLRNGASEAGVAVSTLTELDPLYRELPRFIESCGELAEQIVSGLEREDSADVRRMILQIQASSGVFGYPGLEARSAVACKALEASKNLQEACREIAGLLQLLRTVSMTPPADDAQKTLEATNSQDTPQGSRT